MTESGDIPEVKPASRRSQIIATIVTLVTLFVVFAVIFPQLADYSQAWDAILGMSSNAVSLLVAVTLLNIGFYVLPYMAALPGIRYGRAFVIRQTSFAISNGVPAGGAFGLGVQYSMLSGYGIRSGPATAVIGITSVWNTLVTLALPVLAVILLAFSGDEEAWAIWAALIGLLVVSVAIGLLFMIFRSESAARRIGSIADRVVAWLGRRLNKELNLDVTAQVLEFRSSTVDVVTRRVWAISLTNVGQQLIQFLILFIALRAIQANASVQTTFAQAFVAFAVGRLGSFIPLTPGGMGTVDALIVSILVGFGAVQADALAATLVWRAATFFPQILIGIGTFLVWRRGRSKALASG